MVEARLGDASAREAHDDDPPLEGDALRARGVRGAADRVVDDVGAAAPGDLLDPLDDVLGLAVDDDVAAQLLGDLGLVRAADDTDDAGPGGRAELDGSRPDATGGGVDEEGLPFAQSGSSVQAEPPGLVADHQGGARRVVQPLGRGEGPAGLHEALARVAAVRQRGPAEHPVADGDVGDVRADLEDVAADLHPRDEGGIGLDLVLTAAEQGVGEVHRARPHAHPHLVGPGRGGRGVHEGEDVGRGAQLLGLPCADAHGRRGYRPHGSGRPCVHPV